MAHAEQAGAVCALDQGPDSGLERAAQATRKTLASLAVLAARPGK